MNATQRLKQLNGSLAEIESDDYTLLNAVWFVPNASGFDLQATLDANMAFTTYGKRDEYAGVKVVTLRELVKRNEGAMRNPVTGAVVLPGERWERAKDMPRACLAVAHERFMPDNLFIGMSEMQVLAQIVASTVLIEMALERLEKAEREDEDSVRHARRWLQHGQEAEKVTRGGTVERKVYPLTALGLRNAIADTFGTLDKLDAYALEVAAVLERETGRKWKLERDDLASGSCGIVLAAQKLVQHVMCRMSDMKALVTFADLLQAHAPYVEFEFPTTQSRPVETQGGAYVGGSLTVGGNFTGRDSF